MPAPVKFPEFAQQVLEFLQQCGAMHCGASFSLAQLSRVVLPLGPSEELLKAFMIYNFVASPHGARTYIPVKAVRQKFGARVAQLFEALLMRSLLETDEHIRRSYFHFLKVLADDEIAFAYLIAEYAILDQQILPRLANLSRDQAADLWIWAQESQDEEIRQRLAHTRRVLALLERFYHPFYIQLEMKLEEVESLLK